jgi:hypothetical protein
MKGLIYMEHSGSKLPGSWGIPALAVFVVIGGALLYYGYQKRDSKLGRAACGLGAGMLSKAIEHPKVAEILGPLQNLFQEQLAVAQKLLA